MEGDQFLAIWLTLVSIAWCISDATICITRGKDGATPSAVIATVCLVAAIFFGVRSSV